MIEAAANFFVVGGGCLFAFVVQRLQSQTPINRGNSVGDDAVAGRHPATDPPS